MELCGEVCELYNTSVANHTIKCDMCAVEARIEIYKDHKEGSTNHSALCANATDALTEKLARADDLIVKATIVMGAICFAIGVLVGQCTKNLK